MLLPFTFLIIWTLVMLVWLYSKRLPAMAKAKIKPDMAKLKGPMTELPAAARAVADNYNHLHEAPTLFYALALAIHVAGFSDNFFVILAWLYVILRIAHSLIQANLGKVVIRFSLFTLSSIVLAIMALRFAFLLVTL